MSFYTKNGDNGMTALLNSDEQRLKSNLIFEVLGTIDELNASLGFMHMSNIKSIRRIIVDVQKELFILGSTIAMDSGKEVNKEYWEEKITRIEDEINFCDKDLADLKSFIIPGGSDESVHLHLSRTISRRLERKLVIYITSQNKKNLLVLEKYINRLSDLLFVLSRYANHILNVKEEFVESDKIK